MLFASFPKKTRRLLWVAIISAFLTVFSLVFAFVILPIIIDKVVADYLVLKNGTEAWDRFMELPFPMDFKIYFLEVKNPDDVKNGELPFLVETPPFIYKAYRKKANVQLIGDEHVSYQTISTYEFDAERSELPDDHEVMILNLIAMGLFQIIENANIGFELPVEELLPKIIDSPELFYKKKVKDFLFDGTSFCDPKTKDVMARMICLVVMLLNVKMINYNDDLTMTYSLFGFKQNAHDGTFIVNTGEKDIMKLGQIQSWNDMKYTNIWKGEKSVCNEVDGYDIAVFAPYLEKYDSFSIYSTDVCRSVSFKYLEETTFRDVDVFKFGFTADTWTPENNNRPEDSCYCSDYTRGLDGERSCFMDGVQDVYPCLGIPGIVSFPHLLHADKKYRETVQNLQPDESKHASYLNMQPLTAAPLEGWISLQVNLIIRPIRLTGKIMDITKNLANTTVPLLWLQQGVTITDDLYDMVNLATTLLTVAEIGKIVFILLSGLIFIYSIARLLV